MKLLLLVLWSGFLSGAGILGHKGWQYGQTSGMGEAGNMLGCFLIALVLFILSGVFFFMWR